MNLIAFSQKENLFFFTQVKVPWWIIKITKFQNVRFVVSQLENYICVFLILVPLYLCSVLFLKMQSSEEVKFSQAIQQILQESFNLQNKCEQLFLNQGSVLYRSDSISTPSRDHRISSEYDRKTFTSMSSIDSFVSAQAEVTFLNVRLSSIHFTPLSIFVLPEMF